VLALDVRPERRGRKCASAGRRSRCSGRFPSEQPAHGLRINLQQASPPCSGVKYPLVHAVPRDAMPRLTA